MMELITITGAVLAQNAGTDFTSVALSPMAGVFFGGIVMASLVVIKVVDFFFEKARNKKKDDDAKEIITGISQAFASSMAPVTRSIDSMEKKIQGIVDSITPVVRSIDSMDKKIQDIDDKTTKSWALHNKFDEDGRPRWYIPHTLPDVLQQVSHTCERIVASQNETLKAFKETAVLQQEILQNQKQFLAALQNFQNQQASLQQGLNLLIQQVMAGRSTSTEILPTRPPPANRVENR